MDYSTFHQHSQLARANARRLERDTEILRRIAERAADASNDDPRPTPVRVIRRGWRLVMRHA